MMHEYLHILLLSFLFFCFVGFPFPQNELILFCTFFSRKDNINMLETEKMGCSIIISYIWDNKYWFYFLNKRNKEAMTNVHNVQTYTQIFLKSIQFWYPSRVRWCYHIIEMYKVASWMQSVCLSFYEQRMIDDKLLVILCCGLHSAVSQAALFSPNKNQI